MPAFEDTLAGRVFTKNKLDQVPDSYGEAWRAKNEGSKTRVHHGPLVVTAPGVQRFPNGKIVSREDSNIVQILGPCGSYHPYNSLPQGLSNFKVEHPVESKGRHAGIFSATKNSQLQAYYPGRHLERNLFKNVLNCKLWGSIHPQALIRSLELEQVRGMKKSQTREFGPLMQSSISCLDIDDSSTRLLVGCVRTASCMFNVEHTYKDWISEISDETTEFGPKIRRVLRPKFEFGNDKCRAKGMRFLKWVPKSRGLFLLSDDCSSNVEVWLSDVCRRLTNIEMNKSVNSLDFCNYTSSTCFVCGLDDGTVRICDLRICSPHQTLMKHNGRVTAVSWKPNSPHTLASASSDKTIRIWDTRRGNAALSFCDQRCEDISFGESINAVSFGYHKAFHGSYAWTMNETILADSIEAEISAAGYANDNVKMDSHASPSYFINTQKPMPVPRDFKDEEEMWNFIRDPSLKLKNELKNLTQAIKRRKSSLNKGQNQRKDEKNIQKPGPLLSPQPKKKSSERHSTSSSRVSSVTRDELLHDLSGISTSYVPCAHYGTVMSMKYTPDGRYIISSGSDNQILLWNSKSGHRCPVTYGLSTIGNLAQFDISQDSRFLCHSLGDSIGIFDIFTGKRISHLYGGHSDLIRCTLWNPSRLEVYSASEDGAMIIWDYLPSYKLDN